VLTAPIATTRSTYSRGAVFELSTARNHKPIPRLLRRQSRFDSRGESELTKRIDREHEIRRTPFLSRACSANAAGRLPSQFSFASRPQRNVTSTPRQVGANPIRRRNQRGATYPVVKSLRPFAPPFPSKSRIYSLRKPFTKSPVAISHLLCFFSSIASPHKPAPGLIHGPRCHGPLKSSFLPSARQFQHAANLASIFLVKPAQRAQGNTVYKPPPSTSTCSRPSSSIFFTLINQFRFHVRYDGDSRCLCIFFFSVPKMQQPDSRPHLTSLFASQPRVPAGFSTTCRTALFMAGLLHKPPPAPAVRFAILRR